MAPSCKPGREVRRIRKHKRCTVTKRAKAGPRRSARLAGMGLCGGTSRRGIIKSLRRLGKTGAAKKVSRALTKKLLGAIEKA